MLGYVSSRIWERSRPRVNPFRTGPVGLAIGFLAEIHPLSLFAAICSKGLQNCVVVYIGNHQNIPPASLAAIKEDDKGEEDEQNLGGFDIPAHEKKKQRALDDQAMLERIADHLGALYGEWPVVPLWAHAEARIPDYYA